MKYLLVFLFAALFLAGCSKESNVSGPEQQVQREFLKINLTNSTNVEAIYSASKTINGNQGGEIELDKEFYQNGKKITIEVKLDIPQNAFNGTRTISYNVNTNDATIDFSPEMTFSKDLKLTYKLEGIDLSSITDPELVDFAYLSGNTLVVTSYNSIKVKPNKGLLEVKKAKISHFSRYGWATIDGGGE